MTLEILPLTLPWILNRWLQRRTWLNQISKGFFCKYDTRVLSMWMEAFQNFVFPWVVFQVKPRHWFPLKNTLNSRARVDQKLPLTTGASTKVNQCLPTYPHLQISHGLLIPFLSTITNQPYLWFPRFSPTNMAPFCDSHSFTKLIRFVIPPLFMPFYKYSCSL